MSGGSMDYLYTKVEDAQFEENTPERKAFRSHLRKVAEALRAIEWVDSYDNSPGSEVEAIMACISHADVLAEAVEDARRALIDLEAAIAKASRAVSAETAPWTPADFGSVEEHAQRAGRPSTRKEKEADSE